MTNEEQEAMPYSPGKIRPTQLITTYGPGAIMQTEHDSVMIMGIDFWANKETYQKKNHLYLQKIAKRDHFKMPYAKERRMTIACTSFPRWGHCTICHRLQPHRGSPGSADYFMCRTHTRQRLLPARLVVACSQGHVGDFPWIEWAHSNPQNPRAVCKSPVLEWRMGGVSSSISDSEVRCACGASNRMSHSMDPGGIKLHDGTMQYTYKCRGEMPWLNRQEPCRKIPDPNTSDEDGLDTNVPKGMLARSTSLYYSKVVRGIVIPELAHPIAKFLQSPDYAPFETIPALKAMTREEKAKQILETQSNDWNYAVSDVVGFMEKLDSRETGDLETEDDLKRIEYDDLIHNESFDDQGDNEIKISDVPLDCEDKQYFHLVRKLDILTAIEVLQYFTRLKPPNEESIRNNSYYAKTVCRVEVAGRASSGRKYDRNDWLPCVVKKGEGIFVVFNSELIESFLASRYVQARLDAMLKNYQKMVQSFDWPNPPNIDRQYILLHSLSHTLIKQLALKAGYGEASITERIYSSKDMHGILIYTTSSGEGSLGGLARQALELGQIFKKALGSSMRCSRDPICIENEPADVPKSGIPLHTAQNGSACYGCLMLPETSCENFNKLLDRKILDNWNVDMEGRIAHD